MRILIIEDDPTLTASLCEHLSATYKVTVTHSGQQGLHLATVNTYDLILLDLDLPDMHGKLVCQTLRKKGGKTPVLIVTGESDTKSKITCLDAGADDYITKPFSFDELSARIRALLRRNPDTTLSNTLRIGDLTLDPTSREVKRGDKVIHLRKKEFEILEYLMHNPNRVFTRNQIIDYVWGDTNDSLANLINVHIKYLRDKIDRDFDHKLIHTIHSTGYKIQAQPGGVEQTS